MDLMDLVAYGIMAIPVALAYGAAPSQPPAYREGVIVGHVTAAATVFILISAGLLDY